MLQKRRDAMIITRTHAHTHHQHQRVINWRVLWRLLWLPRFLIRQQWQDRCVCACERPARFAARLLFIEQTYAHTIAHTHAGKSFATARRATKYDDSAHHEHARATSQHKCRRRRRLGSARKPRCVFMLTLSLLLRHRSRAAPGRA